MYIRSRHVVSLQSPRIDCFMVSKHWKEYEEEERRGSSVYRCWLTGFKTHIFKNRVFFFLSMLIILA